MEHPQPEPDEICHAQEPDRCVNLSQAHHRQSQADPASIAWVRIPATAPRIVAQAPALSQGPCLSLK